MLDRYSVSLMKYLQYEYKPNVRNNRIMIIALISQSLRKLLRIARQFVLQWVNIAGQLSGNIKRRSLDSQQQRIL